MGTDRESIDISTHDPRDVVVDVDGRGQVDVRVREPPTTVPPEPPPPPSPADPEVSVFQNVEKAWSSPAPGIRHLSITAHRQKVDIVEVDLASGLYDVRATRPDERGMTTSQFADHIGAVVTVNGDLFESGFRPIGLAAGDGVYWEGTADGPHWLFLACDANNSCVVDRQGAATALDPAWTDVIGGQGAALVVDGAPQIRGDHPHGVERHPRTAVGVTEDGS